MAGTRHYPDLFNSSKDRGTEPVEHFSDLSNPPRLKTGDLIADRFVVVDILHLSDGRVGEADVYYCTDKRTRKAVALKNYRMQMQPHREILEKLRQVDHPDLVRIFAFGSWRDSFYEAMEFCQGGTLTNYLPLNEQDLRRLLPPVNNGLNYLHSQGIVHRDIKPSNILFRKQAMEGLVLSDFGCSSFLSSIETDGRTAELPKITIDYTPPEYLFDRLISNKYDYYSLGITLIHAVTGQSPFAGYDYRSIMGSLHKGPISPPASLSPSFQLLIKGLIQHEPGRRWGYSQVRQWLAGETVLTDTGLPWVIEL